MRKPYETAIFFGGIGQKPEDEMRAAEVGRLLAETAEDIRVGLEAARRLNDNSLIKTGESINQDWLLAQHMAIDWKDYSAALRSLGFIQTSIGMWFTRLRQKGVDVKFRGIYTPPVSESTPEIFAVLKQTASEAVQSLGMSALPVWLLPVGAGILLLLLIRR